MASRRQPTALQSYRDWLSLQGTVAGRCSRYLREATDLVRRRSLDPKEWAANYTYLLCAVVADVGDFTLVQSGETLRAGDEWVSRFRRRMPKSQTTTSIPFEVPDEAFGRWREEITLVTDGLSRGDREVVIKPDEHLRILPVRPAPRASKKPRRGLSPGVVSRSERRAIRMRLFSLPLLRPGVYSGIVCAKETDVTVAVVELEVY